MIKKIKIRSLVKKKTLNNGVQDLNKVQGKLSKIYKYKYITHSEVINAENPKSK